MIIGTIGIERKPKPHPKLKSQSRPVRCAASTPGWWRTPHGTPHSKADGKSSDASPARLIKPFWRLEHLELPKIFWEEKYGQSWVLIHVDGISKVLAVGSTVWYLVRQVSGVISRLFNYGIDFNVWGYAANAESITFLQFCPTFIHTRVPVVAKPRPRLRLLDLGPQVAWEQLHATSFFQLPGGCLDGDGPFSLFMWGMIMIKNLHYK